MFIPINWGKTGHFVVGEIADRNLTPKAKNAINDLLDGNTLAAVSYYADEIKSDFKYQKLRPWHYVNLPLDKPYASVKKNPKGDIVMAIKKCISILKDINQTKKQRAFYLKLLVHLIGDLHQPMHVGRKEDRGGNNIRVSWLGKSSNLHRLWDTQLIDDFERDHVKITNGLNRLSAEEMNEIQKQPLEEWIAESQALAKIIYENTPPNSQLDLNYGNQYRLVVKMQLQKGGLRLATALNKIFK